MRREAELHFLERLAESSQYCRSYPSKTSLIFESIRRSITESVERYFEDQVKKLLEIYFEEN